MAVLDTEKYLDAVSMMIQEGRTNVPVPVKGVSMRPFLRTGDFAYLIPLPEKIRRGDILLFQRANKQYVLHRVYKLRRDGSVLMLGDSQLTPEPVTPHQLRAKVSFVRCAGQDCRPGSFRWWFFACPWLRFARWRPQIARLLALFRKK
jgi:signal peptidase I